MCFSAVSDGPFDTLRFMSDIPFKQKKEDRKANYIKMIPSEAIRNATHTFHTCPGLPQPI